MASPFNITPAALLSDTPLVLGLLNGTTNIDIVGVFSSETMAQIFTDARPIKASIRETSKVMDHPVETGVVLSDHHIINPTEIDISLIINSEFYSSAYQEIKNAWVNATKLSVQTRTGVYPNMIIRDLPHEETPDMFDAIALFLRLKEVRYVAPSSISQPNTPANFSPSDPAKSSTVNRGQQVGSDFIPHSAADDYFTSASGAWQ